MRACGNVSNVVNQTTHPSLIEYPYIEELEKLDSCRRSIPQPVPPVLAAHSSHLQWKFWEEVCSIHNRGGEAGLQGRL